MLKDDCGHLITDEANIVKKFRTYFKDLLNINQDNNVPEEVYPLRYTVQPEITEPDEEEIKLIIKMLKNNKTPSEDNINAELIKISTPKMFSEICTLIKETWKKEQIPQDWEGDTRLRTFNLFCDSFAYKCTTRLHTTRIFNTCDK